ncbi:MAG: putative multidrug export ATP-binding/permease protein [Candidatus Heimdallarchaeota archaeon LC_2]|nr:MAG: putative multidrug export ATP-binding/permease protein [Candidatus Heimdallarchaeota archaeon LC_2]
MSHSTKGPLKRLIGYTTHHRRDIYIATLYSILNKLLDLAPPLLIGAAIDIVVRGEDSVFGQLGIDDPKHQIYFLGFVTLLVWIGESLFEYWYKVRWRNLAQNVEHTLRMDLYDHLQYLELEFYEDRQTGGLMAVVNDDVNQLERFLDIGANDLIQVSVTVITISIIFFLLNPIIGAIALIPIPFILLFSIKFQKRLESRYATMRDKVGILNGRLANNLTGIATIKSYTNENYEYGRINEASDDYRQSNRDVIKLSSAFSPLIRMIIVMGFLGMLIVGGIYALNGTMEIAAYSITIFLIQRLLWPLTRLGETFDQYQRAMASTTRALDLLDTERKIISGTIDLSTNEILGKIELRDVNFSYKDRDKVISNFNLTINVGQTIAFVGPTGSGKSTLVKLLLRFYDPTSGLILLDDINIADLNLKDYRRGIGFVSQDVFLLDGSIKENIAYGTPETLLEDIIKAATIAEIHEFVQSLPQGYETLVGERGQKLSGGQRQRISIARAILKDPPILILDEATSSVDNETEAAIQRSIEKIIVGRTTIVIAHRLSTIRNADLIFVLSHGKLIEQGTHEDLVALDGMYTALWRVQTGETMIA